MSNVSDVIVVGLGAMGSAASYQLSKRGTKVIGFDAFTPPHRFGSSHGETRIIRKAIGEGEHYVPLVLRSYEIWQELEELSGKNLLNKTGGLILQSIDSSKTVQPNDFFHTTVAAAQKYGIKHDILNSQLIKERFPEFNIQKNTLGYYEYDAGFLKPEICISTQLKLAQQKGAELHFGEKVQKIVPINNGGVSVHTNINEYFTSKVVLTAGAWINSFLNKKFNDIFKVYRQILYWFEIKTHYHAFTCPNFPVFIWELATTDASHIYGFPAIDGRLGGLKIASPIFDSTTNPDTMDRSVHQYEKDAFYKNYIKPFLPNLSSHCIKASTCCYTSTPDNEFIIDFAPNNQDILIASPCSGHGFKHSAAIGELIALITLGIKSTLDTSHFKLNRFKPRE